jgi:hypothetical protein
LQYTRRANTVMTVSSCVVGATTWLSRHMPKNLIDQELDFTCTLTCVGPPDGRSHRPVRRPPHAQLGGVAYHMDCGGRIEAVLGHLRNKQHFAASTGCKIQIMPLFYEFATISYSR